MTGPSYGRWHAANAALDWLAAKAAAAQDAVRRARPEDREYAQAYARQMDAYRERALREAKALEPAAGEEAAQETREENARVRAKGGKA